jgi:lipopolysaccharide transport system ATP-binding protein
MGEVVLKIENVSKQYRLGLIGTGTLSNDLNRWWHLIRGKEDPYLKIGDVNDREQSGGDYVWALKNINFQIEQGEVIGIIGKNGAGKSTLLKLLSQVTNPSTGSIKVKGRIASLLEVGTGFHPELTGRENIFLNGAILGMTKSEIRSRIDEIIEFSGVAKYIDTPIKRYSSGMLVRLGFAVAAHLEPEILVVDEVLAVGDADFQKKCISKMKDISKEGRTIIFVSHNMASVRNLCTRGVVLEKGQLAFEGSVDESISYYIGEANVTSGVQVTIPDSKRLYNTGEAKFLECRMSNEDGVVANEFYFRESFNIQLILEAQKKLNSVNLAIGIVSKYGEVIAFSASKDEKYGPIDIESGKTQFSLVIKENLMPGDYFLNLSASYSLSGSSIDFIEYFYPFKVLKETKENDFEYPWATVHGYVELRSNWNIKKI